MATILLFSKAFRRCASLRCLPAKGKIVISRAATLVIGLLVSAAVARADDATHPRPATAELKRHEKVLTIPTRPGVTVRVLLHRTRKAPKGVVVILPGGQGFLVTLQGRYTGFMRGAFSRAGFASAMVDAPSDQKSGLEDPPFDRFRLSAEHTTDLRAVIAAVKKEFPVPVYLFGHSMGAISVAHAAATLNDPDVRAVILAGGPTTRRERMWRAPTLSSAALHRITMPVLQVHHRDDGCSGATFDEASDYFRLLTASPRKLFIEARGGDPPTSQDACHGNNQHSFWGLRDKLAAMIVRWVAGEDVANILK